MNDPLALQYLKSIQDTVNRIDDRMGVHDDRIKSLEDTRTDQNAAIRTTKYFAVGLSGVITFIVNMFHKS